VLVASERIPAGTTAEQAVAAVWVTTESFPDEYLRKTAVGNIEVIEGQVVLVDIAPGQQLLTTMFGDQDDTVG
jgi:hypothetical protein